MVIAGDDWFERSAACPDGSRERLLDGTGRTALGLPNDRFDPDNVVWKLDQKMRMHSRYCDRKHLMPRCFEFLKERSTDEWAQGTAQLHLGPRCGDSVLV